MKSEAQLKGELMKLIRSAFRPPLVITRHEDLFRSGWPDIEFIWNGYDVHIEAKIDNGRFKSKGVQLETCIQIEQAGHCWYVIWNNLTNETEIVLPSEVKRAKLTKTSRIGLKTSGFSHEFVVQFLMSRYAA